MLWRKIRDVRAAAGRGRAVKAWYPCHGGGGGGGVIPPSSRTSVRPEHPSIRRTVQPSGQLNRRSLVATNCNDHNSATQQLNQKSKWLI